MCAIERENERSQCRSFTHSQFCPLWRQRVPHAAHYLGETYPTVRNGAVERWCTGYGDGPGTIEIIRAGTPESLAVWRYRPQGV